MLMSGLRFVVQGEGGLYVLVFCAAHYRDRDNRDCGRGRSGQRHASWRRWHTSSRPDSLRPGRAEKISQSAARMKLPFLMCVAAIVFGGCQKETPENKPVTDVNAPRPTKVIERTNEIDRKSTRLNSRHG